VVTRLTIDELLSTAEPAFQYAKAENKCTGFHNFALPPGCTPATCKLAFDWRDNSRLLLLEQGVRYPGNHAAFRDFVRTGEHAEPTAEGMIRFLDDIRAAYVNAPPVAAPPGRFHRLDGVVDRGRVVVARPVALRLDATALLADLQEEVIGQTQALESLVSVVNTHIRKRKSKRPATVLLAGPTGTGKTQTAEQLAPLLTRHTGTNWGYIRIDMNQLDAPHTIARLLGSPPGYVGYTDDPLFAPVMQNPRHIVLFDEMEKADKAVMKVLMNAMANGRLETSRPIDSKREYDFRQCVFLFTSNLPLAVEDADSMTQADITRACRTQLARPTHGHSAMPPEIAARFTDILLYRELGDQEKVDILALTILRVAEQYDLNVKHIDADLLQTIVDEVNVSNGVREAEYALESMLGAAFAAFADSHDVPDTALSGTNEHPEVTQYIPN
jgi:energy-coupling factor transporter ATP-binding protein EcfA2